MFENKDGLSNSLDTYFSISILLIISLIITSYIGLALNNNLQPDMAFTQSLTIFIMAWILLIVNAIIFRILSYYFGDD